MPANNNINTQRFSSYLGERERERLKQKKNTGEIHARARTFHHEHLHAFFDRVVRLSRAHLVLVDAKRCHARHRLFSLKFGVCALIICARFWREKKRVFLFFVSSIFSLFSSFRQHKTHETT
jgi:hypothetical protein